MRAGVRGGWNTAHDSISAISSVIRPPQGDLVEVDRTTERIRPILLFGCGYPLAAIKVGRHITKEASRVMMTQWCWEWLDLQAIDPEPTADIAARSKL